MIYLFPNWSAEFPFQLNWFLTVSIAVPSNWKKTKQETCYDYELPYRHQLGLRTIGNQKRSGRHRKSGTLVTWRFRSQNEEEPKCLERWACLWNGCVFKRNFLMIWRVETKVPVKVVLFSHFLEYYRVRWKPFCRLANRHREMKTHWS